MMRRLDWISSKDGLCLRDSRRFCSFTGVALIFGEGSPVIGKNELGLLRQKQRKAIDSKALIWNSYCQQ